MNEFYSPRRENKNTNETAYAEPADEKQVWDVYAGNARVQR